MTKNIYTLIILLLATGFAFSQSDLEIITFDDDEPRSRKEKTATLLVVKTNPMSMIFGRQFVEVEYPINDFLTVEGGVGLTFSPVVRGIQNFYTDFYNEFNVTECESPNFQPAFDICDQQFYNDYTIRNTYIGAWLSGSAKFYYYNSAPDEAYLSFNLKYHTSNYDVLQAEETNVFVREIDVYAPETVRSLDYTIRFGYQTLFSPLTSDVFVGVGIRSKFETRLDIGFDDSTALFSNQFQDLQSTNLLLEAGIRLGFEVTKPQTTASKKKKKKRRRR